MNKSSLNTTLGIGGAFTLKVVNQKTGKVKKYPKQKNLILDNFLHNIMGKQYSSSIFYSFGLSSFLNFCSIGTGTTEPKVTDTALANSVGMVKYYSYSQDYTIVTEADGKKYKDTVVTMLYKFSNLANQNLSEIGLVASNAMYIPVNVLGTRALFNNVITLTTEEILEVTYELTFRSSLDMVVKDIEVEYIPNKLQPNNKETITYEVGIIPYIFYTNSNLSIKNSFFVTPNNDINNRTASLSVRDYDIDHSRMKDLNNTSISLENAIIQRNQYNLFKSSNPLLDKDFKSMNINNVMYAYNKRTTPSFGQTIDSFSYSTAVYDETTFTSSVKFRVNQYLEWTKNTTTLRGWFLYLDIDKFSYTNNAINTSVLLTNNFINNINSLKFIGNPVSFIVFREKTENYGLIKPKGMFLDLELSYSVKRL